MVSLYEDYKYGWIIQAANDSAARDKNNRQFLGRWIKKLQMGAAYTSNLLFTWTFLKSALVSTSGR